MHITIRKGTKTLDHIFAIILRQRWSKSI